MVPEFQSNHFIDIVEVGIYETCRKSKNKQGHKFFQEAWEIVVHDRFYDLSINSWDVDTENSSDDQENRLWNKVENYGIFPTRYGYL